MEWIYTCIWTTRSISVAFERQLHGDGARRWVRARRKGLPVALPRTARSPSVGAGVTWGLSRAAGLWVVARRFVGSRLSSGI